MADLSQLSDDDLDKLIAQKQAAQASPTSAAPVAAPAAPAAAPDAPTPVDEVVVTGQRPTAAAPAAAPVVPPKVDETFLGDVGDTIKNIPGSAANLVKGLVHTIAHPIETAKTFGDIGGGVLQHLENALPDSVKAKLPKFDTAKADAVGKFLINRYGSLGAIRQTLINDPVGMAADLSSILTGGEMLAGRLPGIAGEAARAAGVVGNVIDPMAITAKGVSAVAKGAGNLATGVLGATTGRGAQAVLEAAKAGYSGGADAAAFRKNLMGGATSEDTLGAAQTAVRNMYDARQAAYNAGMGVVHNDPAVLPFDDIEAAVKNAEGLGYTRGRSGTSEPVSFNPPAAKAWDQINTSLDKWKMLDPAEFHTPGQLDLFKRELGNIRDSYEFGTPEYKAASDAYSAARKTIADAAPVYDKVMGDYADATSLVKDLQKSLSLNDKASSITTMNKLMGILNPKNIRAGELGQVLKDNAPPTLFPGLAGAALNPVLPRGMQGVVDGGLLAAGAHFLSPQALLAAPVFSPRLVGSAAFRAGTVGKVLEPVADAAGSAADSGALNAAAIVGRSASPTMADLMTKYSGATPSSPTTPVAVSQQPAPAKDLSHISDADLDAMISNLSQTDPLHARVMQQESGGNPNAVSPKGAEGTMQVMPQTQVNPGLGVTPARDNSAAEKERVGHDYLNALLTKYKGNKKLALAAYNWGPGHVDNWLTGAGPDLPAETHHYVKAILGDEF